MTEILDQEDQDEIKIPGAPIRHVGPVGPVPAEPEPETADTESEEE